MAFLKFNQKELVNLEYSLRREIFAPNRDGAYFNTSIIGCNTRKYHGLLVVPVENFGDEKYVLLSSVDESVVLNGKSFNLGIHCYGDIYEPKGHKYIVGFDADTVPTLTYKVGPVVLQKSVLICPDSDSVMVRYRVAAAPSRFDLVLRPFLAYRRTHALTRENGEACTGCEPAANGAVFRMYSCLPQLFLQTNLKSQYAHNPYWYRGVTYSDEYRRGFDCREDLLSPGTFTVGVKQGDEIVFSASTQEQSPRTLKSRCAAVEAASVVKSGHRDMLLANVGHFKEVKNGKEMVNAGFSWLETGLLRETIESLPGLTLYADGNVKEFEQILDNLIADEQERLLRRTTQIEAPLALTDTIQQYIAFTGNEKQVWKKYGDTLKGVIESYAGVREEAHLCDNGLLWCRKSGVALTWMNAYIDGKPVTERGGFQVETNALWYNALCFALEMESKYGPKKSAFLGRWSPVRDNVKRNFQPTFLVTRPNGYHTLADYVDEAGRHSECRPNMMWAAYIPYPLIDAEVQSDVMLAINRELVTRRGIRTLSPRSNEYKGVYEGSQLSRDMAYHNGCTRTALLGPWVDLNFRLIGESFAARAKWLTEGFFEDAGKHGVGAFSELYDGEPPHEPHGAIASACATAALMRCYYLMDKYSSKEEHK